MTCLTRVSVCQVTVNMSRLPCCEEVNGRSEDSKTKKDAKNGLARKSFL